MSQLRADTSLAPGAAAPFRFAIIVSRFNSEVTEALADGAVAALRDLGATPGGIRTRRVPGAYELPMAAHREAARGEIDAVICLGALIRGETAHFDVLANATASAIQDAARATGVPMSFGVITCDTMAQATARAGGERGNKGAEAAVAAVEMAVLYADALGSQG